jgi:hypothetical protein
MELNNVSVILGAFCFYSDITIATLLRGELWILRFEFQVSKQHLWQTYAKSIRLDELANQADWVPLLTS